VESHFLAYLYRLRHIERWSLMRNTTRENVAEHSYHVALLTHLLCEIGNRVFGKRLNADRAAAMALFHDATEVFTGDIPTPVKHHNPRMLDSFREIEALAAERLAAMVPEPLKEAYAPLLKGKTWQRSASESARVDEKSNVDTAEAGEGNREQTGNRDGAPDGGEAQTGEEASICIETKPGGETQTDKEAPYRVKTPPSDETQTSEEAPIRVEMQPGGEPLNAHTAASAEDPDAELRRYLKAADLLDAYLKCMVELASGNREFAVAHRQIKDSLDRLALPEAQWFLERFAPSFGKTLDELSDEA
jgi:5'-deoxynucleotidase